MRPLDLVAKLPKRFAAALAFDAISKPLRRKTAGDETFASVLRDGLGPTISEHFYYPYVRKLWALPPEELSVTLARRRVSGSSIGKILQKILRQVPGFRGKRTGGFFYPRREEFFQAVQKSEADAPASVRRAVLAINAISTATGRSAQCVGRKTASCTAGKPTRSGRRCRSRCSCVCWSPPRRPRSLPRLRAFAFAG